MRTETDDLFKKLLFFLKWNLIRISCSVQVTVMKLQINKYSDGKPYFTMQRRDLRKLEIEKQQHIKSPEWRQLNANAYIHMQTNTTPPPRRSPLISSFVSELVSPSLLLSSSPCDLGWLRRRLSTVNSITIWSTKSAMWKGKGTVGSGQRGPRHREDAARRWTCSVFHIDRPPQN